MFVNDFVYALESKRAEFFETYVKLDLGFKNYFGSHSLLFSCNTLSCKDTAVSHNLLNQNTTN